LGVVDLPFRGGEKRGKVVRRSNDNLKGDDPMKRLWLIAFFAAFLGVTTTPMVSKALGFGHGTAYAQPSDQGGDNDDQGDDNDNQ
jgi:hypothetical protein